MAEHRDALPSLPVRVVHHQAELAEGAVTMPTDDVLRERALDDLAPPTELRPFMSRRQVAAVLGVNESTVDRWLRTGQLRAVRTPGGSPRIRRADLERAMVAFRSDGGDAA